MEHIHSTLTVSVIDDHDHEPRAFRPVENHRGSLANGVRVFLETDENSRELAQLFYCRMVYRRSVHLLIDLDTGEILSNLKTKLTPT